jgi:hypothetical protein
MAQRVRAWRPTEEEVRRIVAEMRPIIHEFAQRARRDIPR